MRSSSAPLPPPPALKRDCCVVGCQEVLGGRMHAARGGVGTHRCGWRLHTGRCSPGRVSWPGWVAGETSELQACPAPHLGSGNNLARPGSPFPGFQPSVWESWSGLAVHLSLEENCFFSIGSWGFWPMLRVVRCLDSWSELSPQGDSSTPSAVPATSLITPPSLPLSNAVSQLPERL